MSSSTPNATATPNSTSTTSGSTRQRRERRRQHHPRRGDHATGDHQAAQHARPGAVPRPTPRAPGSSGRCCSRCPARPGRRRRTAGTTRPRPGKPNTCRNSSAQTPSVAANDSTTVAISRTGASRERSSNASMTSDHQQHQRDDDIAVALGGIGGVDVDSGEATDHGVGAGYRVHGVAQVPYRLLGLRAVGRVGERGLKLHPPVDHLGRRRPPRPRPGLGGEPAYADAAGRPVPPRSGRPGHRRPASGSGPGEDRWPGCPRRRGSAARWPAGRRPSRSRSRRGRTAPAPSRRAGSGPARIAARTTRGADPDRPGPPGDVAGQPPPDARARAPSAPYTRRPRPEDPAPAEQQQRRQEGRASRRRSRRCRPPTTGPSARLELSRRAAGTAG